MSTENKENLLANVAFDALRRSTGVTATVLSATATGTGEQVRLETEDGISIQLPYKIKSTIDRRDQLLAFKAAHPGALLVTRSVSTAMAEQCREQAISFVDHAGNCYLQKPGLLIFIAGSKDFTKSTQTSERGLTPAALRVIFAVLTRPDVLQGTVRSVAQVASISHGAAGIAIKMLEEMKFFTSTKRGGRILASPERWLDAWTEGYLGRIRPKLEKYRMSSHYPLSKAIEMVGPTMREVASGGASASLGGEAAAEYRQMGLKPGTLTLYIDLRDPHVLAELASELKLRRDSEGDIELISMFWNTRELPCFPTVPDALIYADLVGTGDERTMEIATHLGKKICRDLADQS